MNSTFGLFNLNELYFSPDSNDLYSNELCFSGLLILNEPYFRPFDSNEIYFSPNSNELYSILCVTAMLLQTLVVPAVLTPTMLLDLLSLPADVLAHLTSQPIRLGLRQLQYSLGRRAGELEAI